MASPTLLGVLCVVVGMMAMLSDIVGLVTHQPLVQPVGFGLLLATVGVIAIRVGR